MFLRAASLLAFLLSLPLAFLALVPSVCTDLALCPKRGSLVRRGQRLDEINKSQGMTHFTFNHPGGANTRLPHVGPGLGDPDHPWSTPERGLVTSDQPKALQDGQAAMRSALPG